MSISQGVQCPPETAKFKETDCPLEPPEGNIVLLTSKSNIDIRDTAPSEYLKAIIDDVGREVLVERLAKSLVPENALEAALKDDFQAFLEARSDFLHTHVQGLTGPIAGIEAPSDDLDDSDSDATD